jgi:MaoC like domain
MSMKCTRELTGEHSAIFSLDDVRAFGQISRDCNPIHTDPVTARRLIFGAAVAHGLLVVCWVMDRLAADGLPVGNLSRLKAAFRQPVFIDARVILTVTGDASRTTAIVSHEGKTCATFILEFADAQPRRSGRPMNHPAPAGIPQLLTGETIAQARGTVSLGYPETDFAVAFPDLAAVMPPMKVAGLLALTRIVGMECPGARSLFADFDARFEDAGNENAVSFEVTRWDDRFNLATIAVRGAGLSANLSALLRSDPVPQPKMHDLQPLVSGKPFDGQRALVIGGSRGIGEACGKLLALGGAEQICLTYAVGKEDAERVAGDLADYCEVRTVSFNVLTDTPPEGNYTHVYYFPAPRLRPHSGPFNAGLCRLYNSYFVDGMALLFESYVRKSPLRLLQPSSIFVETPEPGFVEYATAKGASECLGRQFTAQHPSSLILTPRFPRVHTDQTQGARGCSDSAAVLMPSLIQLAGYP